MRRMRSTSAGLTGRRKARVAKRATISRAASRGSRPSAMGHELVVASAELGGGGGLYGPSSDDAADEEQAAVGRLRRCESGVDEGIDERDAETRRCPSGDADLRFERLAASLRSGRGDLEFFDVSRSTRIAARTFSSPTCLA